MRADLGAVRVGDHWIGPGHPCFIIAEAGVNHNGDLETARRLVQIAARAGADAVKFQTFKAERLAAPEAPKADYQKRTTDPAESQMEMLRRLELPQQAYRELMAACQESRILFMSTPFDEESADFLEGLGVELFKIPSGEITNLPFLSHVARKGKPMIVSTGMSTLSEVEAAVRVIEEQGNRQIVLLHCVSNYPASPAEVNLRAMQTLAQRWGTPVGYSDHTPGVEIALAAVALGACAIEKHFTLDKAMPGPDHPASAEPEELAFLVRGIRSIESALGHGRKEPAASEVSMAAVIRKSMVAARDIPAGTRLTPDCMAARRPGTGFSPALLGQLIGRLTRRDIPKGTVLTPELLL